MNRGKTGWGFVALGALALLSGCAGGELDRTGCQSDDDCKFGRVCVNGACQDNTTACTSDSGCPAGQNCYQGKCQVCDQDGDTYLGSQCAGPDCNDTNSGVHPGAKELCGDGLDNDCDGVTDPPSLCSGLCATVKCPPGYACDPDTGKCIANCSPSCKGKCGGTDGCNGTCPNTCPTGQTCQAPGYTTCSGCIPGCTGKCGGPDGCNGTCPNTCPSTEPCLPPSYNQCACGCVDGQVQCNGNVVQACKNCIWYNATDCAAQNRKCLNGQCTGGCTNGQKQCNGSLIQICINNTWINGTDCAAVGQTCQNGQCIGGCTNQCPWGQMKCLDSYSFLMCQDYNGDGCPEWGPPTKCPAGEQCDFSTNSCTGCIGECQKGQTRCLTTNEIQFCDKIDPAGCFYWGTTIACGSGQTCDAATGQCAGGGHHVGANQPCGLSVGCPTDWSAAYTCVERPGSSDGFCSYPCTSPTDCNSDFPGGCCGQLAQGFSLCLPGNLCGLNYPGYLQACASSRTCLPDMDCIQNSGGGTQDYLCLFTCDLAMGDCPLNGQCLNVQGGQATGLCLPSGSHQFGEACSLTDGCASGLVCMTIDQNHPGYCDRLCSSVFPCPNGFQCIVKDGQGGLWCGAFCSSDADCSHFGPWVCVDTNIGLRMCLPK